MRATIERLSAERGLVALCVHAKPDADAVGGALALHLFLRAHSVKSAPVSRDAVPRNLRFLPSAGEFLTAVPPSATLVALLDAPDFERTALAPTSLPVLRVDHHPGGAAREGDVVDEAAPATASLLLSLFTAWDEASVTPEIATCLFVGLMTDTVSFRVRTDERAFADARALCAFGADAVGAAEHVYREEPLSTMRLYARALGSMELAHDGRVALVVLSASDFAETGAELSQAERAVEFPASVGGVLVGLKLCEEEPGLWGVSMRSRGVVNVGEVARALGGGGHRNAAACRVRGDVSAVKSRVLDALATAVGVAR